MHDRDGIGLVRLDGQHGRDLGPHPVRELLHGLHRLMLPRRQRGRERHDGDIPSHLHTGLLVTTKLLPPPISAPSNCAMGMVCWQVPVPVSLMTTPVMLPASS